MLMRSRLTEVQVKNEGEATSSQDEWSEKTPNFRQWKFEDLRRYKAHFVDREHASMAKQRLHEHRCHQCPTEGLARSVWKGWFYMHSPTDRRRSPELLRNVLWHLEHLFVCRGVDCGPCDTGRQADADLERWLKD